jgi:hypothetical protein
MGFNWTCPNGINTIDMSGCTYMHFAASRGAVRPKSTHASLTASGSRSLYAVNGVDKRERGTRIEFLALSEDPSFTTLVHFGDGIMCDFARILFLSLPPTSTPHHANSPPSYSIDLYPFRRVSPTRLLCSSPHCDFF